MAGPYAPCAAPRTIQSLLRPASLPTPQLVRFVADGGRLEIPDRMALPGPDTATFGGLDDYTGLIRRCWAQEPADRPGFQHIIDSLRWVLSTRPASN